MVDYTEFRGLNTKKKWVYGSLVRTTTGLKHKQAQHTETWIVESAFGNGGWFNVLKRQYVKPETVCQYSGLNSKDGVKIYDGDIVYIAGKGTCLIVFDGLVFEAEILDKPKIMDDLFYLHELDDFSDLEKVVGNMHDTPELLKEH